MGNMAMLIAIEPLHLRIVTLSVKLAEAAEILPGSDSDHRVPRRCPLGPKVPPEVATSCGGHHMPDWKRFGGGGAVRYPVVVTRREIEMMGGYRRSPVMCITNDAYWGSK